MPVVGFFDPDPPEPGLDPGGRQVLPADQGLRAGGGQVVGDLGVVVQHGGVQRGELAHGFAAVVALFKWSKMPTLR